MNNVVMTSRWHVHDQSCFGQNLVYGGAQTCIFSLIVAFVVQLTVTTGLAELGSAFPVGLECNILSLTNNIFSQAAGSIISATF